MTWRRSIEKMGKQFFLSATLAVFGLFFSAAAVNAATVTVNVQDQNGDPVEAASVMAWSDTAYETGTTNSSGVMTFTATTSSTSQWWLSVDGGVGYGYGYSQEGFLVTGDTSQTVTIQKTDAVITATLKQDGVPYTLQSGEYASVYCHDDAYTSFFDGYLQEGASSTSLDVVAGTYTCEAWLDGSGTLGATVTVATGQTGLVDITILTYDSSIVVNLVDTDGNVLIDITSFEMYGMSTKDDTGTANYNGYLHGTGENGTGTMEVLDGWTYEIGTFISGGENYGGDKSEGDFGYDDGSGGYDDSTGSDYECDYNDPEADCGSGDYEDPYEDGYGGDDEYSGDDEFNGFSSVGIHVTSSDTNYIQNYEMIEVVADASDPQIVNFTLAVADATLQVTVLDENGDGTGAWVMGMQGSKENAFGSDEEGTEHGWGNFVGGGTNADGEVELAIQSGVTYEIFAHPQGFGGGNDVLPPPKQVVTLKKNQTKAITMQFVESDHTLNITTSTIESAGLSPASLSFDFTFCYGYSPEGGYENFAEITGGSGTMPITGDFSWYIGCMGYVDDTFYRTYSDTVVSPQNGTSDETDVTIELSEAGSYYDETQYTIPATSTTTIIMPDGESSLTIPANAIGESGNNILTVKTATSYKVVDDTFPIDMYDFSVVDSAGQKVTEEFGSKLTYIQAYDEEKLDDLGIDEDALIGSGYSSSQGWSGAGSSTVDTDEDTVTMTISHFSSYGITADKGLSIAQQDAPNRPKKLTVKKLKKKSARLKWTAPKNADVDTYTVQLRQCKNALKKKCTKAKQYKKKATWKKYTDVTKAFKNVKKLKKGTYYQFRVKAVNTTGSSTFAKWQRFKTKGVTAVKTAGRVVKN